MRALNTGWCGASRGYLARRLSERLWPQQHAQCAWAAAPPCGPAVWLASWFGWICPNMRGSIRPKDMCTAPTARSVAVSGCPRWWRVASPRRTAQHHSAEFTADGTQFGADGTQFGADGTQFGADTRSVLIERIAVRRWTRWRRCAWTASDACGQARCGRAATTEAL